MNKFALAALALIATINVAHAGEQVLIDKNHGSFKACTIVNGVALADLKAKGFKGGVVVNAGGQYVAKVTANGATALMMCDGGQQIVTLITR